ncbi:hypothetical protein AVEN_167323-1 [Araneus ventricosus]|uniref:Uncharacterized protein n=1 Tax=Araneus ventricosus TaxID=182803 RepID=A0A4Y2DC33_ARAVE|nr:hypothetical protein AVEN_167323-1 [Araneus ventricosus]
MDKTGDGFNFLKTKFPRLSEAKIKEGIFVAPQIRQLFKDSTFMKHLNRKEKRAWLAFKICEYVSRILLVIGKKNFYFMVQEESKHQMKALRRPPVRNFDCCMNSKRRKVKEDLPCIHVIHDRCHLDHYRTRCYLCENRNLAQMAVAEIPLDVAERPLDIAEVPLDPLDVAEVPLDPLDVAEVPLDPLDVAEMPGVQMEAQEADEPVAAQQLPVPPNFVVQYRSINIQCQIS